MFSDDIAPKPLANSKPGSNKGASTLQISEAKALKAIEKYSIIKKGEEKNKKIVVVRKFCCETLRKKKKK